jgi:alpha-beta hydrolase superfamily lysophospholipase
MITNAPAQGMASSRRSISYHTVEIEGVSIFYREAGPASAPAVLLLHGFPSSSRMWEPLLPLLADKYHLVAPDYPGFGYSRAPYPSSFEYTFDNLARVMNEFTTKLGVTDYVSVHAGLWRPCRLSHGARSSGARPRHHYSERRFS